MPAPTLITGAPCWIDLYTSDPERAQAFYGTLFGWETMDPGEEYGGYVLFQRDGKTVAGCMRNDGEQGAPDTWSTYLTTGSADRVAEAAKAKGSPVFVEPIDVTENGRFTMLADPGGAPIGAWQPKQVHGFEIRDEPGAPTWFELHTHAYDASVEFYREVFGWDSHTMADTGEFRYTTLGEGETMAAGIMDASVYAEPGPATWEVYFSVEDCDEAAAKAAELGSTIEDEPKDTPYGRIAIVTDPTGSRFRLHQRLA